MNEAPEMNTCENASDTPVRIGAKKTVLLSLSALAFSVLSSLTAGSILAIIFMVAASALLTSALVLSGSKLPLTVAPAAYVAAGLFFGDLPMALTSLDFVLVAMIAADAFTKKRPRVSIICRISAALTVFEIAILAVLIYTAYGAINADIIRTVVTEAHTATTDALYSSLSSLPEDMAVFSYESLSSIIAYVFVLLPSALITAYNVLAYLIQRTVIVICRMMKAENAIAPASREFVMSRAAALMYILSYLLTVFFAGGGTITALTAVTENLIVVFTPGLALFGVKDYLRRYKEKNSPFKALFTIGMVFLLFTVPPLFFGLSAFSGAWAAFRKN